MPANRTTHTPAARQEVPHEHAALAAILAVAFVLRAFKLDAPLWYDEIDTLLRYVRLPWSELVATYDSLNNHMFFSLQAKLAVALFGESPWALRLPAMLFGVGSIWALWRLARPILGAEAALLAALLMAVSYHHVWFSQNARGYTGLLFFGLAATQLLIRAIERPRWGPWLGFMACLVAAMYTHLSAGFFFLALGVAWLSLTASAARRGALQPGAIRIPLISAGLALAVLGLLYAPTIGQMAETFGAVQAGPASDIKQSSIAEWKNPFWTIGEVIRSLGPVLGLAAPVVAGVLVISMIGLSRTAPILPLVFTLHIALTVGILMATSFRIWPRYFLVDIGLICLMLIHGACLIGGWLAARMPFLPARSGVLLAMIGIAASLVLLPRNYLYPKQDFEGAREFVEAERSPEAQVFALGLTAMPFTEYYAPDWIGIDSLAEFDDAYEGGPAWLVYTFPDVIERRLADLFEARGADFEKARYLPGTLAAGGIVILKSGAG